MGHQFAMFSPFTPTKLLEWCTMLMKWISMPAMVTGQTPIWKITSYQGKPFAIASLLFSFSHHSLCRYSGLLRIDREGEYKFYTTSDDGSFLFINGIQVRTRGVPRADH